MAAVEADALETAGKVRVDPYYWLAKRDDPAVSAISRPRTQYADAVMKPLAPLESEVYAEIKGRIKKDDSVGSGASRRPLLLRAVRGRRRVPALRAQARVARRARGAADRRQRAGARPLVLLDRRGRGELGREAARVRDRHRRPPDLHAAVQGPRERPHPRRRDPRRDRQPGLGRGRAHDLLHQAGARDAALAPRLPSRRRHRSGKDALVYEETDPEFDCSVGKTRSRRYLVIESEQTLSTEVRYLDATHPEGEFRVLLAREPNHEYSVDHLGDWFFIRTNWNAPNFRLMRAPIAQTGKEALAGGRPRRVRTCFSRTSRCFATTSCSRSAATV